MQVKIQNCVSNLTGVLISNISCNIVLVLLLQSGHGNVSGLDIILTTDTHNKLHGSACFQGTVIWIVTRLLRTISFLLAQIITSPLHPPFWAYRAIIKQWRACQLYNSSRLEHTRRIKVLFGSLGQSVLRKRNTS